MKRIPNYRLLIVLGAFAIATLFVVAADTAAQTKPAPPDTKVWTCPQCGAECPQGKRDGHFMKGPRRGRGAVKAGGRHGRNGRQRGNRGMSGPGTLAAERLLKHAQGLKLNDAQIDQLKTLAYDAKKRLIDLQADMRKSHLEFRRRMESDSDDIGAMKRDVSTLAQKRADIQILKLEHFVAAKKVLTDEQKKAVSEQFPRLGRMFD